MQFCSALFFDQVAYRRRKRALACMQTFFPSYIDFMPATETSNEWNKQMIGKEIERGGRRQRVRESSLTSVCVSRDLNERKYCLISLIATLLCAKWMVANLWYTHVQHSLNIQLAPISSHIRCYLSRMCVCVCVFKGQRDEIYKLCTYVCVRVLACVQLCVHTNDSMCVCVHNKSEFNRIWFIDF